MSTAARVALKKCAYAAQYPEQAEEFLLNLFWFSVFTFILRDLFLILQITAPVFIFQF